MLAGEMRMTRRQFLKRGTLAAGAAAAVDGFALEPWRLRIIEIDRRDLGLGKKIVHFTDVHHTGDKRYLERIVATINAQQPDLVMFTGDLVNGNQSRHLAEAMEICGRIRAPVYGVAGNHDPWHPDCQELFRAGFAATGGKWLVNEALDLGGFALHGTNWWTAPPPMAAGEKMAKRILLCHYPAVGEQVAVRPYDLILSGHSHGGQVLIPLLGAVYLPPGTGKYIFGHYNSNLGKLFVSAGVGTTGIRVRFLCPPDIAVFRT
jgi:hypothetical protein